MKQFSNGGILLLFYNNGHTSFADDSRNPYWLSSGVLTADGRAVMWSQPEIVIYNREHDDRPGYPGELCPQGDHINMIVQVSEFPA